jgi:DNA-binding NtrC family response regulator
VEDLQLSTNPADDKNDNDKPIAKLLVVDDDADVVQVLKMGLVRNRFLVEAFINPEEALQSFKSNAESYCLLLSDMRMPSLSGIQIARKVKEINPNVRVVLMTAFGIRDEEFAKVFPSSRVDCFLRKPITIRDLIIKIMSLIGQSKRRGTNED